MNILEAQARHFDQLVALFDAYRIFYRMTSDPAAAAHFLKERIEQKDSVIYVAEQPGSDRITGFAQMYPIFSSTRLRRLWLLNDLFVQPAFRSQGISKLLIERCKEQARATNAAGILLETEKSNTIGNHLYPATGFELDTNHHYFFGPTLIFKPRFKP